MTRKPFGALAISLLVAANAAGSEPDRVALENVPPGEEWGLLIDGTTNSGAVDDRTATGTGALLELENFRTAPGAEEELIAVTRDRALELVERCPGATRKGI